jgi:hypothetical protein
VVDAANVKVVRTIELADDWVHAIANAPAGKGVIAGLRDGSLVHVPAEQLKTADE